MKTELDNPSKFFAELIPVLEDISRQVPQGTGVDIIKELYYLQDKVRSFFEKTDVDLVFEEPTQETQEYSRSSKRQKTLNMISQTDMLRFHSDLNRIHDDMCRLGFEAYNFGKGLEISSNSAGDIIHLLKRIRRMSEKIEDQVIASTSGSTVIYKVDSFFSKMEDD